jgi:membrane-associated phospholipid phosphatase
VNFIAKMVTLALCASLVAAQESAKAAPGKATSKIEAVEGAPPNLDTGETSVSDPKRMSQQNANALKDLPKNLLIDQEEFWTSPLRWTLKDATWLVPLTGVTAGSIALDGTMERGLPKSTNVIHRSRQLSNYGVAGLAGLDGGFYLLGAMSHNEHLRETGFLGGEAAIDALGLSSFLQQVTQRERPFQGNGNGRFWQGGTSFPSDHASGAWSLASVFAHEYPGPLTELFAYGAASAISISRVTGRKHFPSDVLIGSALGWYMGRQVYNRHHNFDLGGAQSPARTSFDEERHTSENRGSPYVPLDSWIYPALDRLAALGYINTQIAGLRPWTRSECARLVGEAEDAIGAGRNDSYAVSLYEGLAREFSREAEITNAENRSAQVESIYTRIEGIAGKPLNDSYHFGQTLINDFGRPYSEGVNAIAGASGWVSEGPLVLYLRGEYQHAPSTPAYPQSVRSLVAAVDQNPVQPPSVPSATNQFQLLDSYVGLTVLNTQISFGKESLWWGPGEGGSLVFSDNADPLYMLRASQVSPTKLPGFLGWLGPMRTDLFFGKLSGQRFPRNAYIHGEKISFKPTPNLELGFSRTAELAGTGRLLTPAAIFNSYVSPRESSFYTPRDNPGKRTGGFDISYRPPFVRDWLTLYLDSLSSDDPSPIASPRRAAISPGLYMSHIPKLPKFDFRAEAANTNTASSSRGGQFIYHDFYYHDLYTNNNDLIGNWIGREGTGIQVSTTYWHSATSTVQLGYRHAEVAKDFIPKGGTVNDYLLRPKLRIRSSLELSGLLQYEKWDYPVLSATRQSDFVSSIQITFFPGGRLSLRAKQ